MRRLVITLLLLATATAGARQSRDVATATPSGSAQIAGAITSSDATPVPLRRVTVALIGERGVKATAVTDDAGRFVFTSLPADRYSLTASKGGYVPMSYGSKRPGGSGTPVVVADGQRATIAMRLFKGSVITGTVRDERGRPLPAATVTVQRYAVSPLTGERALESVIFGSANAVVPGYMVDAFPGTAVTDDRGEYRIFGLAPGDYVVVASAKPPRITIRVTDVHRVSAADVLRAERLLRGSAGGSATDAPTEARDISRVDHAPVFYPAALSPADATTISLGAAEERSGIDIAVRYVSTARVSGFVTGPDGSPIYNAQVSVMSNPLTASGRVDRSTRSGADGEFTIPANPPGRYQIQASVYPEGFFGTAEVEFSGRDITTSIVLLPGVTISGRIIYDGKTPAPPFSAASPFLRRSQFAIGGGTYRIETDGRITFANVVPGQYRLSINGRPPEGWILRSVIINGTDVSDIPFDVTRGTNIDNLDFILTDRPAEISGVLQNADGSPATDYVLVVFSGDPRYRLAPSRRTHHVRPDINGRFIVRNLPAGEYLLAAVTDIEPGQWNDRAFLNELAAASPIKITLAEGDKKVQDIRIAGR